MADEITSFGLHTGKEYLPIKPQDQLRKEFKIRQQLVEQGVPHYIANAVIGYRPNQVLFIYTDEVHEEDYNRNRDNPTESYETIQDQSSMWIGTTLPIWDLRNENGWRDQIPEVIVQWRGLKLPETEQQDKTLKIERDEVKHLENGSFVKVIYSGVSAMGEFDGEISEISLNIPDDEFRPYDGPPRKSFKVYYARKNTNQKSDGVPGIDLGLPNENIYEWELDLGGPSNVIGTVMLGGFKTLVIMKIDEIRAAKQDFSRERQALESSTPELPMLYVTEEQEFEEDIRERYGLEYDKIMSLMPAAVELMAELLPSVITRMQTGSYNFGSIAMEIDGILNHPEEIWIMGRRLNEIPSEQRFHLAQLMSRSLKNGGFQSWIQTFDPSSRTGTVFDIARKNAQNMLRWFKHINDGKDWPAVIEDTRETIKLINENKRIKGRELYYYKKVYDGMASAVAQRYIEYLIQQYFGNFLS